MKLPLKLSFQLMSLEASAAGKQILAVTLDFPICRYGGGGLPSCLISLVAPRKVVEFQSVEPFSYCTDGSGSLHALYMFCLKLEV